MYGKEGRGLDVDKAVKAVSDGFRLRAETGQNKAITLPVATRRPTVSDAEVDRKMKSFAKPAMSGLVTVQTDPQHSIPFGPDKSLPKILSMKVVDGKLVEHCDLSVLKQLYGSTFDGVSRTGRRQQEARHPGGRGVRAAAGAARQDAQRAHRRHRQGQLSGPRSFTTRPPPGTGRGAASCPWPPRVSRVASRLPGTSCPDPCPGTSCPTHVLACHARLMPWHVMPRPMTSVIPRSRPLTLPGTARPRPGWWP
ncbi:hypothetical protein SANTM175S_04167 [Streptomyces antimycoticus]